MMACRSVFRRLHAAVVCQIFRRLMYKTLAFSCSNAPNLLLEAGGLPSKCLVDRKRLTYVDSLISKLVLGCCCWRRSNRRHRPRGSPHASRPKRLGPAPQPVPCRSKTSSGERWRTQKHVAKPIGKQLERAKRPAEMKTRTATRVHGSNERCARVVGAEP